VSRCDLKLLLTEEIPMKQKTLIVALTLAAPVSFLIGCGGMNETRVAEQSGRTPIEQLAQPAGAEALDPQAGGQQPVDDIAEAVFAEMTPQLPVMPGQRTEQLSDPVAPQPDTLAFYFATNHSGVQQADFEKLIAHAEYLMQNPTMSLRILGHTDQSGSAEYNRRLAKQRAEAVARVLIDYGVQPSQIHVESLGEDKPIAGLEHAIADRRVELQYEGETQLSDANSF
jgi:peptidoglycan-associated lipoprotein